MKKDTKEYRRRIAQVIEKAGTDASFRKRFLAEPKAVLEEHGIILPDNFEVQVVEETEKSKYILLPYKPIDAEGGAWLCGDDSYDAPCIRCN
ncbi:MAG TPA: NHLP leader peptide family RiPP precursor [Syntrophorhabdaceae bacterium]|jgi:hypothetical protein